MHESLDKVDHEMLKRQAKDLEWEVEGLKDAIKERKRGRVEAEGKGKGKRRGKGRKTD